MTYTSQQRKGWVHENKTKAHLLEIGGEVTRAPQSGAYTGEQDLTWKFGLMTLYVDCKYGKDWIAKRHRRRLEKAQICIDNSARQEPLVFMTLETLKLFAAEMAAKGVECTLAIQSGKGAA